MLMGILKTSGANMKRTILGFYKTLKELFKILPLFTLKILAIYTVGLSICMLPIELSDNFAQNLFPYLVSLFFLLIFFIIFYVTDCYYEILNAPLTYFLYFCSFLTFIIWIALLILKSKIALEIGLGVNNFIMPLLLVIPYIFYYSGYINKITRISKEQNITKNVDEPKQSIEQDRLNREILAKRVFGIIEKFPNEWSLRIGIIGDWGSGKTSLMNFVKTMCLKKKYCVVWFNPWVYRNERDLWKGFANHLEESILRNAKYANLFLGGPLFPEPLRNLLKSGIEQYSVGKAINELIYSADSKQDALKKNVETMLDMYLGEEGKIVVFIDDIDRISDNKMELSLWVAIKEVVNLKKIVYVIGYDENVTAKILEKGVAKDNGYSFLEKIIDFRIALPHPVTTEFEELVMNEISEVKEHGVREKYVYEIIEILPRNPRALKRYIKSLAVLKPTLEHFGEDEIDIDLIYIAQLITMEFPEVINSIMNKPKSIELFTLSGEFERELERNKVADQDKKEALDNKERDEIIKILLDDTKLYSDLKKERIIELVKFYQSRIPKYYAQDMDTLFYFRVIESPNSLTKKSFLKYYNSIKNNEIELLDIPDCTKYERYVERLIEFRYEIIFRLIRLNEYSEEKNYLSDLTEIDRQLRKIISMLNKLNPKLYKYAFQLFMKQLVLINREEMFEAFEDYQKFTRSFLSILIAQTGDNIYEYKQIMFERDFGADLDKYEKVKEIIDSIEYEIDRLVPQKLIPKFSEEHGIKSIFSNTLMRFYKSILFSKPILEDEKTHEQLVELSKKAESSLIIHENFMDYFNYLMDFVLYSSNGVIDSEGAFSTLKDSRLLEIISRIYFAVPLSTQTQLYFKQNFKQIKEIRDFDIEEKLNEFRK